MTGVSSSQFEAVFGDIESSNGTGTTLETESGQAKTNADRKIKLRRLRALCACCSCVLVLIIAVAFIMVFCMQDPEWEVVETHIDPAAIAAMSVAVGMGSNTTTEMTMTNTVRIYNPNIIGAFIEPEVAHVTCHDEEFATSQLDAFTLRRRSTTMLVSNVTVSLSPTLAPLIVQDVMTNNGTIIVYARSDAIARTGIFTLHTGLECKIWANMMPFMTGVNPQNSIQKKECKFFKSF
jgi:LEA14-like dessication related protein